MNNTHFRFKRAHKKCISGSKLSNISIKNKLLQSQDYKCKTCLIDLKQEYLQSWAVQLDHRLPVALGGEINGDNFENIQILCYKCHQRKTSNDIAIISFLKRVGCIERSGVGEWDCYLSPKKVKKIYFYFFNMMLKNYRHNNFEEVKKEEREE